MEHRHILSGHEYLPFARSCIQKLKATGLAYANQSYEVGGVSIKVRIEPGHEFIRIEGGGEAYMESGQLEYTFPGLENPTRLDPAKWNFVGIPTDAKYLGWASTEPGKKNGGQNKKQVLTEDMDSKAIGPPIKVVPPNADAETIATINALNAEKRLSYEDSVLMRKLVISFFPPSFFSGKMRLFMQAQYGATQQEDVFPFFLEIFGTSVILKYRQLKGEANPLQFGTYASSSPGIFRAPMPPEGDGSYWLINVTKTPGFTVTAYPLKLSSKTAGMRAWMRSPKSSAEDKQKCEAYILAHAVILVDEPRVIHHFEGTVGDPFAYGWKFNDNGSEASIVVHKGKGLGENHDLSWLSYTMRLNIGCTRDPDTDEYNFTVADSTTPHGEWTDGWGYWNIFVPESEFAFVLTLKSLKTNVPAVRLDFNFADVPVYGYYANNVWTPVTMSRDAGTLGLVEFKNKTTGPVTYGGDVSQVDQAHNYGIVPSAASMAYEQQRKTNKKTMILSFGGKSYHGETSNVAHHYFTRTVTGGSASYSPGSIEGPGYELTWPIGVMFPPGYPTSGGVTTGTVSTIISNITTTTRTYDAAECDAWVLVISPGDCEAVYIATRKFTTDILNDSSYGASGSMVTHFAGTKDLGAGAFAPFSYEPYTQATTGHSDGFRPPPVAPAVTFSIPIPPAVQEQAVFCYNAAVQGVQGTPSGSYTTLFDVDRNYPYFNGVMYTYTSAGKRYVMSEGLTSPSVNYQHRFVGWA